MAVNHGRFEFLATREFWTSRPINALFTIVFIACAVFVVFDGYSKDGRFGAVIGVVGMVIAFGAHWYAERVRRRQNEKHRSHDAIP